MCVDFDNTRWVEAEEVKKGCGITGMKEGEKDVNEDRWQKVTGQTEEKAVFIKLYQLDTGV